MTGKPPSFQPRRLEPSTATLDFDEFAKLATQHAREGFSQVTEPEGDLAPFLLMAERHGLGIVQWDGLEPNCWSRISRSSWGAPSLPTTSRRLACC